VPLAPGADEIFYPGEIEDRAATGELSLPAKTLDDLRDLGASCGVPFEVA
jgi:hypothetical protein